MTLGAPQWKFFLLSAIIHREKKKKGGGLLYKQDYKLPQFDYFQFGNVHCGSLGALRWRIEPRPKEDPPVLHAWKWKNGLCFEKREEDCPEADFPLSPEGLEQLEEWFSQ